MLALKVPLKKAQEAKMDLLQKGILDDRRRIEKDASFIYFPLKKRMKLAFQIIEREMDEREIEGDIKSRLSSILSPEEMKRLKTAADFIGDIAIIELDKELESKKREIAEEFLRQNKSIRTVLMKRGGHEGDLRLQRYGFLAGEKRMETVHRENGARIKLDVEKVYYSPRTAMERKRIAELVKPGENVLVMFSGCAPFPCVIAKNAKPERIVGIELNDDGHRYGMENVALNKLRNVELICGDVREIVPKLIAAHDKRKTAFDRIIMPLPRSAGDFLDVALSAVKKGTVIHFYSFQREDEFEKSADIVRDACKKANKRCEVLRIVKAGQNAPRSFRICVDFIAE